MGVHLTIPEDALSSDHVIAIKVIYDPDIHLPGSARRGRMTPLLKLEPEGLVLNKPAQLTIPHSAIIPEPDRHDVMIFTGLKDEQTSQEGEITWTEEKSINWKLHPEKISLDFNILSYVFVNLVSEETEQKHIFRIVPFIDGILDAKDDVLITVCFCKDSDEEYKLLLEDHQSKLSLGNYTTFHITRKLNDGRDYASYIDLRMSSPVDSYHLMKEESTKHVDIDHLCAASRVSHQFRLNRNKYRDTDMVDVKLKVSQHEKNQTALILQSKASSAHVTEEAETLLEEHETLDLSQQSTLAADYGRLMVNVADDLTLDSTLKLATLFGLPPAETDMLRRVSLIETPGITLINFMKTRNIINMYDVTNLQKGLVYIQLNQTNDNLLAPYQSKVDPFQFEENQHQNTLPGLLQLLVSVCVAIIFISVENVSFVPDDKSTPSQGSNEREEYHDHSKESLVGRTEKAELPKQRKDSEMRHHHAYIEHRIKCEGGTISIMGVHLTIPEDAVSFDHVIAVKVIYDPEIHLPGSARRGRMTPLIKLEPEGLTLNKPAQLTIPHSAIIPEPDRHDVIVFTGLKDEENSLVSQETEQKHIFRIVPFIDGILDAKDDVLITVCFCKDSDEEYKLLLEDHQSKLSLGNYTTFQVTRTLNDGRDYASYIDLMMSSPGDSYHLMKEESTKEMFGTTFFHMVSQRFSHHVCTLVMINWDVF
ncbi:hypothetical protein BSL78_02798 [Apostichopus japonicus]|uniref:Netrin receptor UNC5 n=1 Tax=Stichopus japonicus TaxID=307972 RepID=A0A2G8LJB2_STIJA|nr:hypothetical protein BSL78_02798 [Apostichopus japonicus]